MVTHINGGAGSPGQIFASQDDLLTALGAAFATEGWITLSGSPTALPWVLESPVEAVGIKPTIQILNSGLSLQFQGILFGSILSNAQTISNVSLANSRLWLTVDPERFVVAISPQLANLGAVSYGRLIQAPELVTDGYIHINRFNSGSGNIQIDRQPGTLSNWTGTSFSNSALINVPFGCVKNGLDNNRYILIPYTPLWRNNYYVGQVGYVFTGFNAEPLGLRFSEIFQGVRNTYLTVNGQGQTLANAAILVNSEPVT